jgi:homoserine kinase
MPESIELMRVLRQEGHPAVISGAGPSVLVMAGRRGEIAPLVRRFVSDPGSWRIAEVALREQAAAPVVG